MAARRGRIVGIGLPADGCRLGGDTMELGEALADAPGLFHVRGFGAANASGAVLGHAGLFVAAAATLVDELALHQPKLLEKAAASVTARQRDVDFVRLDARGFLGCPRLGFEQALAGSDRLVAIAAELGWHDVRDWSALWHASEKDGQGNAASGNALLQDAENCYVRSDGPLTAVVGLSDVVLVVTDDAVLATHRDQAGALPQLVQRLRHEGRQEVAAHPRNQRPWGYYESLLLQPRFQVKRLVVDPGRKLSLQKHFHRAEHWTVVQGCARVTRDGEQHMVGENESIHLPLGCIHRLENPGLIPLVVIEVQLGAYLGEDDIVRVEDDYARL